MDEQVNHADCCWSSTILETLSVGRGDCDFNGFFAKPCTVCARRHEEEHPEDGAVWPFAANAEVETRA